MSSYMNLAADDLRLSCEQCILILFSHLQVTTLVLNGFIKLPVEMEHLQPLATLSSRSSSGCRKNQADEMPISDVRFPGHR